MANEDLTELHFFGIPTAYFDLFPKGEAVVIRTVLATALLCNLHASVADLALRRINESEFELLLLDDSLLSAETIQDLQTALVEAGTAFLPVTIHQVRLSDRVVQTDVEFELVIS